MALQKIKKGLLLLYGEGAGKPQRFLKRPPDRFAGDILGFFYELAPNMNWPRTQIARLVTL